jgi:dolichyl-phosphate-mannose--protein O-mannosyl transferase
VTFVVDTSGDQVRAVLCTGGRVLWWSIVPALLAGAWQARRRQLRWLLPVVAILATWLPWAVLGRFGMTYYLLPALPFAAVLVAALVARLRVRGAMLACAALVLGLFAATYPILAAVPMSRARFAQYTAIFGR